MSTKKQLALTNIAPETTARVTIMTRNILDPASTLTSYIGGPYTLALLFIFIVAATYLTGIRFGIPIARRLLLWCITDLEKPVSPKLDASVRLDLQRDLEGSARWMGITIAMLSVSHATSFASTTLPWLEGKEFAPDSWISLIRRCWWSWVGGSALLVLVRLMIAAREGRWDDGRMVVAAPQPFVGASTYAELENHISTSGGHEKGSLVRDE